MRWWYLAVLSFIAEGHRSALAESASANHLRRLPVQTRSSKKVTPRYNFMTECMPYVMTFCTAETAAPNLR